MDRARLTITLKQEVINQIDHIIDGTKIRNRSHAIEYLLSKTMSPHVKQAVILAGGNGIKMRPLTYEIPKALIPIKNRPILEYIISTLREYNIRDIIISIDHLGNKIRDYFGDGSKFGVKITYIDDKKPAGTATPLKNAKNILLDQPFLIWHGDVLADIDLNDLIDFHLSHKKLITMALTSVEDPSLFGAVKLRGSKVVSFQEKAGSGPEISRLINAGIYVVNPGLISRIPDKKISFLEEDVLPYLVKNDEVFGYVFEGQWFDVSTPKDYERAIKEWPK